MRDMNYFKQTGREELIISRCMKPGAHLKFRVKKYFPPALMLHSPRSLMCWKPKRTWKTLI